MNTRGGLGIVIASMAYEFSIINQTFFVVLILAAITTSLISGIWFKFILVHNWPLYDNEENKLTITDSLTRPPINTTKID